MQIISRLRKQVRQSNVSFIIIYLEKNNLNVIEVVLCQMVFTYIKFMLFLINFQWRRDFQLVSINA